MADIKNLELTKDPLTNIGLILPKSEGNMLGSLLLAAISEYFADENHKQEFEAWQKNEKRRKEGGK